MDEDMLLTNVVLPDPKSPFNVVISFFFKKT